MANITLKGSERVAMPGARELAPSDPNERLEVTLLLRRRDAEQLRGRAAKLASGNPAEPCLSREQFAERHGAGPNDFAAVRAFAAAHGLAVVLEHVARRTVMLSGTVAQVNAAFNVQLKQMQHESCSYRGRTGAIQLPQALEGIVEAVLGLDSRPQAMPHFRIRPAASSATSFTPTQIAALYGFPASTGLGQCLGVIELGGGFRPADLDAYFKGLKVDSPAVIAVSVDHAQNSPTGDANGPDGEVMLDIEVIGAIVPQAKIAVYFAPNTDAGFLDAITSAVHDATNKPTVISISWGGPESSWTSQAMTAMDEAFQAAATMGITVCIASGDNGSSDGVGDGGDHVDFPASSPFALACGGTSLEATASAISAESVWNDGAEGGASGGGISGFFATPAWQTALSAVNPQGKKTPLNQRGVPDVAGNADPETGYQVRVDGSASVIGGTSAVAPLWAALIARVNQLSGKPAGLLNPQLYRAPAAFRDITQGNNGDFAAAAGWDACTGLGSPNGAALLSKMQ
ncbi:MAG TPA: S53 family peptidase [Steroidobacteraceae bacterium]|nr:S53 family peptidase [Steroidobacteraceae bacterium]